MKEIHISLDKKRFLKIGIMASFCLILSFLFAFFPSWFLSETIRSKVLILILGIFGILFFGIVSLYNWRKYLNTQLGIYITEQGILDTSSVFRFGWIEWSDIITFKSYTLKGMPMIFIEVRQNEKYLERLQSPVLIKAAQNYQNLYQTPLFINLKSLSISPKEVENLLNEEWKKRR